MGAVGLPDALRLLGCNGLNGCSGFARCPAVTGVEQSSLGLIPTEKLCIVEPYCAFPREEPRAFFPRTLSTIPPLVVDKLQVGCKMFGLSLAGEGPVNSGPFYCRLAEGQAHDCPVLSSSHPKAVLSLGHIGAGFELGLSEQARRSSQPAELQWQARSRCY